MSDNKTQEEKEEILRDLLLCKPAPEFSFISSYGLAVRRPENFTLLLSSDV